MIDYGNAIKDLAAADIFTGDMLLKNFGVTRNGRVICYDYDELCLLSECRFRRIPQPRSIEEEFAAEPWFHVGEHDIFPEEFQAFLAPAGPVRQAFLDAHADLFDVEFWKGAQDRLARGEVLDVFPYPRNESLQQRGLSGGRSATDGRNDCPGLKETAIARLLGALHRRRYRPASCSIRSFPSSRASASSWLTSRSSAGSPQ